MSKNTDHPSKPFITVGGALRKLEDNGADSIAFMQLIIDDPMFRAKVLELYASYRAHEYVDFSRLDSEGAVRFWTDLVGRSNASKHSEEAKRIIATGYQDGKELIKLLSGFDPRTKNIFRLYYGLDGSPSQHPDEIAPQFGSSTTTIRKNMEDAFSTMLKMIDREQYELRLSNDDSAVKISDLDLHERTINCFHRARIDTMQQLLSKREDDLLAITNFGQRCLDNVIEELAKHNLQLRVPEPK